MKSWMPRELTLLTVLQKIPDGVLLAWRHDLDGLGVVEYSCAFSETHGALNKEWFDTPEAARMAWEINKSERGNWQAQGLAESMRSTKESAAAHYFDGVFK